MEQLPRDVPVDLLRNLKLFSRVFLLVFLYKETIERSFLLKKETSSTKILLEARLGGL